MTCHAYIQQYRVVIYRWKALELSFSAELDAFAYLPCTFSRRPCPPLIFFNAIALIYDEGQYKQGMDH